MLSPSHAPDLTLTNNSEFGMVSWEMGTLNPWGWGGPRTHCPSSWVSALIWGYYRSRGHCHCCLLPCQLHLKEESNDSCILEGCDLVNEREVCSQNFSRIGSLRGLWCHLSLPCWILLGLPKPSQAHDELNTPPGWDGRKRGLGVVIFFGCWNFLKTFLSDVISKHWDSLGRAASMEPFNGHPEFPSQDVLFPSLTTKRSYRGALKQGPDHLKLYGLQHNNFTLKRVDWD